MDYFENIIYEMNICFSLEPFFVILRYKWGQFSISHVITSDLSSTRKLLVTSNIWENEGHFIMLVAGDRNGTTRKSHDFTSFDARLVPPTNCPFLWETIVQVFTSTWFGNITRKIHCGEIQDTGFAILPSLVWVLFYLCCIDVYLMTSFVPQALQSRMLG
jgi:hypothetical protein